MPALLNKKFGRLTVISIDIIRSKKTKRPYYCGSCSCGNRASMRRDSLVSGATRSCGCLQRDGLSKITHNMTGTPEYRAWCHMKERCYIKSTQYYHRYGLRGITVCDRWLDSFENFFADMGLRPSRSHSLDRVCNDSGYTPQNCKWSTAFEQAQNTCANKWFYATSPIGRRYKSKVQAVFARKHNLTVTVINAILCNRRNTVSHRGWTFEYCK